jgi:hypothetical protein
VIKKAAISASCLLSAALLANCGETTAPGIDDAIRPLVYEIFTGCLPQRLEYDCGPDVLTVSRGDTLIVGHSLHDSSGADPDTVIVTADCAVNFEILRSNVLVGTLLAAPTCPDSTLPRGENAPQINLIRAFAWRIPTGLAPGQYTLRSRLLVNPNVSKSLQITVQ